MKHLFIGLLCFVLINKAKAQLYINGAVTIQNGVTLYVDDTIQLASGSVLTTNGILQSTKGINTNQNIINTGITGSIITPIPSGVSKTYDIGTSSNNKLVVLHTSTGTVTYQMAVRDNVYVNPQTNSSVISANAVNKTWIVQPLSNSTNNTIGLYWNATDELSGFNRTVSNMGKWQSGINTTWSTVSGNAAATLTGSNPAYAKTLLLGNLNSGSYYFGVGDSSLHSPWTFTPSGPNIFNDTIKIVGAMNGYDTSLNSNTNYRRISLNTGSPTDGRGQWVKTYNVQNSGGDFLPSNMTGGTNNGFLFISGPRSNRFTNKWSFSGTGSATLNSVNSITSYSNTGGGTDMALNMLSPGRYTFVFNDAGYTSTNSKFYIAYTAATPVSISSLGQIVNLNRTVTINITTSSTPSLGENVYVRYSSATDFSSANTSSIVQAFGSGTFWTATIPAQNVGTTIKYYAFTSTASSISSMNEIDKSLVALNYNDNAGANYSYFITKGISRFNSPTPVICGTSTNYNINNINPIVGDTFSGPYKWQYINNTTDSTLAPTDDVTTKNLGNKTQSVHFKLWRRISRSGTTNPDTSNWVLITMNPLPTASISGTTAICKNSSFPNVTFTGASGTSPYTFTYNINGGSNTTVSTTSGNSVTVSVPTSTAGTFTYNLVSVQDASATACSQSQSGSATITVNPLPTANISGTTTACKNSSLPNITFTGASGTTPYTFTYNINGGSNTTVSTIGGSSVPVSVSTANFGTFTYNLVSVQDASSTACSQSQSGSATVTIAIPTVTSSPTATICSGTSPNLTLTTNMPSTFVWTLGTNTGSISGASASNGILINQTLTNPSNANIGSIIYNVTPTATTGSCVGNPTAVTVIVNPRPILTSSFSQTVCSGVSSSVSLTSTTSGGTNSFTWSTIGNNKLSGFVSSDSSNTIGPHSIIDTANTPQNIVYNILPKFTNNSVSCAGTSANFTYTVNPIPSVTSTTSQTICSGVLSSVILTANTSGGLNSFTWSTAGNSSLSGFATSGTTNRIGTHTITSASVSPNTLAYNIVPTFTNNSVSCTGLPASHEYTINPIPQYIGARTQTICSGNSTNLSLTSNTLGGLNIFSFTSDSIIGIIGNKGDTSSKSISQNLSTSNLLPTWVKYLVTPKFVYNNVGCTGNSIIDSILVNTLPKPVITAPNSVCTNSTNTISTNIDSGSVFLWDITGGNIISGQGTSTINVNWGNGSNATILLKDSIKETGCVANTSKNISVLPLPNPLFTFTQSQGNVTFTPQQSGLTYKWYFGDGDSSNNQNPMHNYKNNGTYTVKLKVVGSNSCENETTNTVIVTTVGLNEINNLVNKINIYPNPTSGIFTISTNYSLQNIELFDIAGKNIFNISNTSKQNKVEIDLSQLSDGIYFINTQNENGQVISSKIVLTK